MLFLSCSYDSSWFFRFFAAIEISVKVFGDCPVFHISRCTFINMVSDVDFERISLLDF